MWNEILESISKNKDLLSLLCGSGIFLAAVGSLYKFIIFMVKEVRKLNTRSEDSLPFKVISQGGNVGKEILGGTDNDLLADRNIPYQQRASGRNIRREIEEILIQNHWVLITGKTGIGKTREAVNVAESLNKEGWTMIAQVFFCKFGQEVPLVS